MKEPPLSAPIPPENELVSQRWIEGQKLAYDHNKHYTTLSTACVVILATFMEKFAPQKHGKEFVWVAIALFLFTLIGSAWAMAWVEYFLLPRASYLKYHKTTLLYDILRLLTAFSFFGGVMSLGYFVLLNLEP